MIRARFRRYIRESIMLRPQATALVLMLEIAVGVVVSSVSLAMIEAKIERIRRPSGLDVDDLVVVQTSPAPGKKHSLSAAREDVALLSDVNGVLSASTLNVVPFGNSSWNATVRLPDEPEKDRANATMYVGGRDVLSTLGLVVSRGRGFEDDDYVEWVDDQFLVGDVPIPNVIATEALARELFRDEDPIGKHIFMWRSTPHRIVGVVEHLIRPNDKGGPGASQFSVIFPVEGPMGTYLVRAREGAASGLLDPLKNTLEKANPHRLFRKVATLSSLRDRWYQGDRSMVLALAILSAIVILISSIGIAALTSISVQMRVKEIAIRRALGASSRDVLLSVQCQVLLICLSGAVLGACALTGVSGLLSSARPLGPLGPVHVVSAASLLVIVGQLASLGAAMRAAKTDPARAISGD